MAWHWRSARIFPLVRERSHKNFPYFHDQVQSTDPPAIVIEKSHDQSRSYRSRNEITDEVYDFD